MCGFQVCGVDVVIVFVMVLARFRNWKGSWFVSWKLQQSNFHVCLVCGFKTLEWEWSCLVEILIKRLWRSESQPQPCTHCTSSKWPESHFLPAYLPSGASANKKTPWLYVQIKYINSLVAILDSQMWRYFHNIHTNNVWGMHIFRCNMWRIWKKWAKQQKCLDDESHMIIVTFIKFFFFIKNLPAFFNNTLVSFFFFFFFNKTYQCFSRISW